MEEKAQLLVKLDQAGYTLGIQFRWNEQYWGIIFICF